VVRLINDIHHREDIRAFAELSGDGKEVMTGEARGVIRKQD
jgi:hypothetical protein